MLVHTKLLTGFKNLMCSQAVVGKKVPQLISWVVLKIPQTTKQFPVKH